MHKKTRNLNVLRSIYLRQGNSFDPCVGVVDVVYRVWIWPFSFSYFSNVEERYFDERDSKVNNIGR